MTATTASAADEAVEVVCDLDGLAALASRITGTKLHLERLYDARRAAFRCLIGQGISQAQVGRTAGVSSMAVAIALGKPKQKDSPASS